ncbi:uncharacterized protein LOC143462561 [Clavelina lepadiformis]|uniref:uncharacterized protein LOC143462561 n=1 Tax=Clavelina lepadiformis TaxID=159417 RepID=UPI0040435EB1
MILFLVCLVTMLMTSCRSERLPVSSLHYCHYESSACPVGQFNCGCEDNSTTKCIPWAWVCDGEADCSGGNDEIDCDCPGQFQCGCPNGGGSCKSLPQCVEMSDLCDSRSHCASLRDEFGGQCPNGGGHRCPNGVFRQRRLDCDPCIVLFIMFADQFSDIFETNTTWRIGNVGISSTQAPNKCSGWTSFDDGFDEWNCDCPSCLPSRCACNQPDRYSCRGVGYTCYLNDSAACNGVAECIDGSDEWDCTSCPADRPLRCQCNQPGNYTCDRYEGAMQDVCYEASGNIAGRSLM